LKLQFDLVIFDCDGVLVDSELIFARVLAECLIAVDFPTTIDEAITLGFGKNRATLSAAVAARFGRALPDTFFETFAARSAAAFEHELSPLALAWADAALELALSMKRPVLVLAKSAPPTAVVARLALHRAGLGVRRVLAGLGDAEVPDLHCLAVGADQDVSGLDVAMNDSRPVGQCEGAGQIRGPGASALNR